MDRVTLYELVPKLRKEGWKQTKIAEFLSISQARVSQILRNPVSLLPQWGGHLKSKLSSQQRLQLMTCLQKGALHYGFEGMSGPANAFKRSSSKNLGLATMLIICLICCVH